MRARHSPTQLFTTDIDLHMHSLCSDGIYPPEDLYFTAKENGVQLMALTDHDTFEGCYKIRQQMSEMQASAGGSPITCSCLFGVEASAEGGKVHVLGYWLFDPRSERGGGELVRVLNAIRAGRVTRAEGILQKLEGLGMSVDMEEVVDIAGPDVIARPHIAKVLVKRGFVETEREAFDKYLADDKPAFVPLANDAFVSTPDMVKLLRNSGAFVSIAHPTYARKTEVEWKAFVKELASLPSSSRPHAIEAFHSDYDATLSASVKACAQENKLVCTIGSDYHGLPESDSEIGHVGSEPSNEDKKSLMCALRAHFLPRFWLEAPVGDMGGLAVSYDPENISGTFKMEAVKSGYRWKEEPGMEGGIIVVNKLPLGTVYRPLFLGAEGEWFSHLDVVTKVFENFGSFPSMSFNFTGTDRYYDGRNEWVRALRSVAENKRQKWSEGDFNYHHLKIFGHGSAPGEEVCSKVALMLRSLFSNEPGSIAYLHCTHGVNRSGYTALRAIQYMQEEHLLEEMDAMAASRLSMSVSDASSDKVEGGGEKKAEDARDSMGEVTSPTRASSAEVARILKEFEMARGLHIGRQGYVKTLYELNGVKVNADVTLPTPHEWDLH
eukprot:CAMPEP_0113900000 /NCGR_PEP_ID=MMETSP0780_2-20120614/20402_1 /TAXON_ID=652834 /ORGANISM="Palpitomonas bilix" /LENGTH=606 /DNA_ID=CAMNT_0000892347 /DNA_START=55 /DNA_END=1875 /DNA_ORIENTATION=- /assembly_acc=CAM_ASM_000599